MFGQSLSDRAYNKVIDACALKADFQMLPAGDNTEIGEKVCLKYLQYKILFIIGKIFFIGYKFKWRSKTKSKLSKSRLQRK